MQTGFVLQSGRELPLVVERLDARRQRGASRDLARLRVQTDSGVVPVMALASMRRMPPPPMIVHHNGRRELTVMYRLSPDVPATGPNRLAIEEQIANAVRSVPRPNGFTVEVAGQDEATSWFRRILVPVVLLLLLVLAMTFESLTLPVLVLFALPLTVLGATWALVFTGMPLDIMAMLGALTLLGLTVNPAILLVDRMQQLVLGGGWSAGAAALAVGPRADAARADDDRHDRGGPVAARAHHRPRERDLAAVCDDRDRRSGDVHAAHAADRAGGLHPAAASRSSCSAASARGSCSSGSARPSWR